MRSSLESAARAASVADSRRESAEGSGSGLGSGELRAVFALFVEADQALGAAVAIHEFLRQHGAQPAFERSAAGKRGQLRNAFAVACGGAVELGIESVGEIAGGGIFARNAQRRLIKLFAIAGEEKFPGGIVAGGAGPG